jgi:sensor c-di-GMP phosphodiesterase-like protein
MWRREKLLIGVSVAAFAGVALVFSSALWFLWHDSVTAEEAALSGLAVSLGERTEGVVLDTRNLLDRFDRLPGPRCTRPHLLAMEEAAATRPYLRAIGYWRADKRQCGVGFLQTIALKPPKADRIYPSGVIAWWPGPHTEVGGVPLFLIRYGDHDAAIDPRRLLEIGPAGARQVGLWLEHLPLVSQPERVDLPAPASVPVGVNIDRARGRIVSRFSRNALLPIDIVASEPFSSFWDRHLRTLAAGSTVGLLLACAWLAAVFRFTRKRLSLAAELREAIAHDRIEVHYQPIVDLATGRCVGAEALARWTRHDGEAVSPEVFIPLAEREGLVSAITMATLDTVIRDLGALRAESPELAVHVNLSPQDLKNETFAEALADRLATAGLPSGAIHLEITERAWINSDAARRAVQALRLRGHQIAIDDFGTGYSSLSYLETFELDVLKIDKSFVTAIETSEAMGHVIGHVIKMARSLELRTIAEGVETRKQRRWLIERGVTCGQGFLFSEPLAVAAFAEYVASEKAA